MVWSGNYSELKRSHTSIQVTFGNSTKTGRNCRYDNFPALVHAPGVEGVPDDSLTILGLRLPERVGDLAGTRRFPKFWTLSILQILIRKPGDIDVGEKYQLFGWHSIAISCAPPSDLLPFIMVVNAGFRGLLLVGKAYPGICGRCVQ